jgi:hypothetical protein
VAAGGEGRNSSGTVRSLSASLLVASLRATEQIKPAFLTPYLSLALSSIGLKTQQFLFLQATAFLDRDRASS